MDLRTALNIVQIILSVVLVVLVLLQTKGSGLGSVFGGSDSSIYRTRRGVEKRIFQFTIALSVIFILFSIVSFAYQPYTPLPAVVNP